MEMNVPNDDKPGGNERQIEANPVMISSVLVASITDTNLLSMEVAEGNESQKVKKCVHFSIRGHAANGRKQGSKIYWPSGYIDLQGLEPHADMLPSLEVPNFKMWVCKSCIRMLAPDPEILSNGWNDQHKVFFTFAANTLDPVNNETPVPSSAAVTVADTTRILESSVPSSAIVPVAGTNLEIYSSSQDLSMKELTDFHLVSKDIESDADLQQESDEDGGKVDARSKKGSFSRHAASTSRFAYAKTSKSRAPRRFRLLSQLAPPDIENEPQDLVPSTSVLVPPVSDANYPQENSGSVPPDSYVTSHLENSVFVPPDSNVKDTQENSKSVVLGKKGKRVRQDEDLPLSVNHSKRSRRNENDKGAGEIGAVTEQEIEPDLVVNETRKKPFLPDLNIPTSQSNDKEVDPDWCMLSLGNGEDGTSLRDFQDCREIITWSGTRKRKSATSVRGRRKKRPSLLCQPEASPGPSDCVNAVALETREVEKPQEVQRERGSRNAVLNDSEIDMCKVLCTLRQKPETVPSHPQSPSKSSQAHISELLGKEVLFSKSPPVNIPFTLPLDKGKQVVASKGNSDGTKGHKLQLPGPKGLPLLSRSHKKPLISESMRPVVIEGKSNGPVSFNWNEELAKAWGYLPHVDPQRLSSYQEPNGAGPSVRPFCGRFQATSSQGATESSYMSRMSGNVDVQPRSPWIVEPHVPYPDNQKWNLETNQRTYLGYPLNNIGRANGMSQANGIEPLGLHTKEPFKAVDLLKSMEQKATAVEAASIHNNPIFLENYKASLNQSFGTQHHLGLSLGCLSPVPKFPADDPKAHSRSYKAINLRKKTASQPSTRKPCLTPLRDRRPDKYQELPIETSLPNIIAGVIGTETDTTTPAICSINQNPAEICESWKDYPGGRVN